MEHTFLVKTINKKTIEVEGKLVKKPVSPKPPLWFNNWSETFENKMDQKFDQLNQRIDNLVKVNNLKEA